MVDCPKKDHSVVEIPDYNPIHLPLYIVLYTSPDISMKKNHEFPMFHGEKATKTRSGWPPTNRLPG
jgi:hypothetical protein